MTSMIDNQSISAKIAKVQSTKGTHLSWYSLKESEVVCTNRQNAQNNQRVNMPAAYLNQSVFHSSKLPSAETAVYTDTHPANSGNLTRALSD